MLPAARSVLVAIEIELLSKQLGCHSSWLARSASEQTLTGNYICEHGKLFSNLFHFVGLRFDSIGQMSLEKEWYEKGTERESTKKSYFPRSNKLKKKRFSWI